MSNVAKGVLTDKQKKFCDTFVKLGGTREAKKKAVAEAYPNCKPKGRADMASELLHIPKIQAEIRQILDKARYGYIINLPKIQKRAVELAMNVDKDGKERAGDSKVPFKVQADLLKDLQDRAGMKPAERHEVLTGTVFAVMTEDDAREVFRQNIESGIERLLKVGGKRVIKDEAGRIRLEKENAIDVTPKKVPSTREIARQAIQEAEDEEE